MTNQFRMQCSIYGAFVYFVKKFSFTFSQKNLIQIISYLIEKYLLGQIILILFLHLKFIKFIFTNKNKFK